MKLVPLVPPYIESLRPYEAGRTIESVLAQDEPDFELIVVDDGSSDGTKAWLAAQTDSRLQVIA